MKGIETLILINKTHHPMFHYYEKPVVELLDSLEYDVLCASDFASTEDFEIESYLNLND